MRIPAVFVPAGSRQNTNGLNPRQVSWRIDVPAGQVLEELLLDAKYTVTDASISAGETFQGVVKSFQIFRLNPNGSVQRRVVYAERDCLVEVARALFYTEAGGLKSGVGATPAERSYSDDQPTTATEEHSYYRLKGPFETGSYYIVLALGTVTSEWGSATVFTADVGIHFLASSVPEAVRGPMIRYVESVYRYAQTDIGVPASHVVHINTLTNLYNIQIAGAVINDVMLESLERAWAVCLGQAWDYALGSLTHLAVGFNKPTAVGVKYSAATNLVVTRILYFPPLYVQGKFIRYPHMYERAKLGPVSQATTPVSQISEEPDEERELVEIPEEPDD